MILGAAKNWTDTGVILCPQACDFSKFREQLHVEGDSVAFVGSVTACESLLDNDLKNVILHSRP